jgi:predicted dehydrogenase
MDGVRANTILIAAPERQARTYWRNPYCSNTRRSRMTKQPIRVGFIGLNPDGQWAATAHIPALASLVADFTISGVANSSAASGQRAAAAFGLPHAFTDADAMVRSDAIDLVVVTVKVPHHHALVKAALDQNKHVYCEWPLGRTLAEARDLTGLADARGVVAAIGTQMRVAPEVEHLRKLIADGYVGEVLSTTLVGSGGEWGAESTEPYRYLFERANGATMLTIPLAHTLAGFQDVLGGFDHLDTRMLTRRPQIRFTDSGRTITRDVADQIMVHGTLGSGAAFAIHYRGGSTRATNFRWEINGTEGDIVVTGPGGNGQIIQLSIAGARGAQTELQPLMPPASVHAGWPETSLARNVARVYALVAQDIRTGSRQAPSFRDAVALHETIEAIERAADTGG